MSEAAPDTKKRVGRPPKDIDADWVFRLAKFGLTQAEIAEVFNCDQSVISKRFASEFASARGQWKMSLKRAQTRRAVTDGSDAMLIHLGKSYLGQTDKLDVTSGGEKMGTVVVELPIKDLHPDEDQASAGTADEVPGIDS